MTKELLVTTNGFTGTWPAIEYGAWLAGSMQMKITLLGVTEGMNPAAIDDHHPLEDIFERAVSLFKEKEVAYSLEVQNGDAEEVISQKANHGKYITLVGPLGRPNFKRWLTGRSIRSLMEQIRGPILYVPYTHLPLKKLLISVGGLGYEVTAENLAFQVALASHAEVTILHVIPPADLDYPSTREVSLQLDDLINTDTLSGRSLKKALNVAQQMGLNARATARRGNIVEEILAEINDGDYDLVCMGSSYSTSALRQYYTPNVTAEIAETVHCPVLTVRYKPKSG